ncbi:MAG: pyridoxamine 5'-phosphate oxidase family protein [Sedimentisphaerales bacterium]|nr:pyridoxamine 5'-phosphate oxidase family protein [Sedimentisphaerales bacterium]
MSDPGSEIRSIVGRINRTCTQRTGFDALASLFHQDAVMVQPDFTARAMGRDACLKNYADACSQMKFEKFDTADQQIDAFGGTAVMSQRYNCVWEFKGKTFTDDGREIFVFVQDGTDWKVAWRTLIPGTRQVEAGPAQRLQTSERQDVRETSLHLIATVPVCGFTTLDADGYPHTTTMYNLRCAAEYPSLVDLHAAEDNDFCIYLATANQSAKMARLKANPKVSLYFSDADQFISLMLGGDIEVIEDQTVKDRVWQEGWTMYFPSGRQGPEYGVIKLAPSVVKGRCRNRSFVIQGGG